jgi:hypothetical protein
MFLEFMPECEPQTTDPRGQGVPPVGMPRQREEWETEDPLAVFRGCALVPGLALLVGYLFWVMVTG